MRLCNNDNEEIESNFEQIFDCEGESVNSTKGEEENINSIISEKILPPKRIVKSFHGKYTQDVLNTADYIEGRISKNPKPPKTVISSTRSEFAANKPIVSCNVEKVQKNVLFDSGCESNVIDESFFRYLAQCTKLKILKCDGKMRCANG